MNIDARGEGFEGQEALMAAIEENENNRTEEAAGNPGEGAKNLSRRSMLRNLGGAAAVGAGAAVVGGIAAPNLALAAANDLVFLDRPIRLYDTRPIPNLAPFPLAKGVKLAENVAYDLQVTGTSIGTPAVLVPDGALGVIGTLTVTQTETAGLGGYLSVYQTGLNPAPSTSNINWFGANQNLATLVMCELDSEGKMTIHNGQLLGSAPTHVIFDASGYISAT